MQTGQTAFEEAPSGHLVPAVIIRITDDKTREDEEEIHRQIAVIDDLRSEKRVVRLKTVKKNHQQRGHATQPVQYLIAGL